MGGALGSRNKLSTDTKQIIMEVAEELGGVPAMLTWARIAPRSMSTCSQN